MRTGVVVHEEVDRDQEVLEEDLEVQEDDTGIPSSTFYDISQMYPNLNNVHLTYTLSYFIPWSYPKEIGTIGVGAQVVVIQVVVIIKEAEEEVIEQVGTGSMMKIAVNIIPHTKVVQVAHHTQLFHPFLQMTSFVQRKSQTWNRYFHYSETAFYELIDFYLYENVSSIQPFNC